MSKNDSLTKFNEINYRKKLIKKIQIKNFSKIFNINNHSKIEKKKKKIIIIIKLSKILR
jgi:hypothetical protein